MALDGGLRQYSLDAESRPAANLRFGANEIDSHVAVRTGRIDLAGNYTLLSIAMISPARRRIDDAR